LPEYHPHTFNLPFTMTKPAFQLAQELQDLCPDLAHHIARCTEQAYRRGYQQGALYGKELDRDVCNWRFDGIDSSKYDKAIAPPDRRDLGLHPGLKKARAGHSYGYTCSAIERLSFEAGAASELIDALAHNTLL
jgi:hypothetical protein